MTGLAAKELIVPTLGILYGAEQDESGENASLRQALVVDPAFNPLTAFALMLFTLLLAPCFATLNTIRSELGCKWLSFSVLYMTATAWIIAFLVYQLGSLTGL